MNTSAQTTYFSAKGAELRAAAATGDEGAKAEIARRANSGKKGYVRESLRKGVLPACWAHEAPKAKVAKAPTPVPAATLATLAPIAGKPAKGHDTIAAVRKDLTALAGNVQTLVGVVGALAENVGTLSAAVSAKYAR